MARFFNTAGLCFPEKHYVVDPLNRLDNIIQLIKEEKYFVIHAPRQTGKTTAMRVLMEKLNAEGEYTALHFSCEAASVTGEDFAEGNRNIVENIIFAAKIHLPPAERPPEAIDLSATSNLLYSLLNKWAASQKKPIVLLIDEIDSLSDLTLISILRQLRNGYQNRPRNFPQAVALIGLKDIRDYKVKVREELKSMGTSSHFNIKDKSLTLRNFTAEEVKGLYLQHTGETGQSFSEEVFELAFYYTQGQPWLVNALARECVEESPKAKTTETITADDMREAKEAIIQRRDTHLDSLIDKLREERVQKVLEPILAGDQISYNITDDDILYVYDLGLVKKTPSLVIANPIYQEVIPRALNNRLELFVPAEYDTWLDEDGKLDWETIWTRFLEFWRENGAPMIAANSYHEIAPHLVLMAYLQRIANGRGEIIREYAIGRGRMDLLVRWPYEADGKRKMQREAIELKVWRPDGVDPLKKGLEQLDRYLSGLSMDYGTLVIFDRREGLPRLEERVSREFLEQGGKRIQLIRG